MYLLLVYVVQKVDLNNIGFFQNIAKYNIFAHFLYTQLCFFFEVQTVVENPQSF